MRPLPFKPKGSKMQTEFQYKIGVKGESGDAFHEELRSTRQDTDKVVKVWKTKHVPLMHAKKLKSLGCDVQLQGCIMQPVETVEIP